MNAPQITDTISVTDEFFFINATSTDLKFHAIELVDRHVKQDKDRLQLLAEAAKLEMLAKLIKEQAAKVATEDITHYGSEGAEILGVQMTIEQGQIQLNIQ